MNEIESSHHHEVAFRTDTTIWRQKFFGWVVFCRTPSGYTKEQAGIVLARRWNGGRAVPFGIGEIIITERNLPLETE